MTASRWKIASGALPGILEIRGVAKAAHFSLDVKISGELSHILSRP